jgi:hypothetical protein
MIWPPHKGDILSAIFEQNVSTMWDRLYLTTLEPFKAGYGETFTFHFYDTQETKMNHIHGTDLGKGLVIVSQSNLATIRNSVEIIANVIHDCRPILVQSLKQIIVKSLICIQMVLGKI